MTDAEIDIIRKDIVLRAKAAARYDQGALQKSIASTYVNGIVIFRQLYYGDYGTNSKLEEIARKYMPRGVPYKIILTELGGRTYESGRTVGGRASRKVTNKIVSNSSNNIKKLLALIKAKRKKEEDGEKEE